MHQSKEFWKWSLLVFLTARAGDVVQALVDLWIVPQNVQSAELGAILPVVTGMNILALPLAIAVVPCSRWLAIYLERREQGKVKALLQLMLLGTLGSVLLMGIGVWLFAPKALSVLHVSEPGFPMLLLIAGMLAALAPVLDASLQGLKKFCIVAWAGSLAAGARLLVSMFLIPLRTFGGYLLGIVAASGVKLVVTVWGLRKELGAGRADRSFIKTDGCAQLRYAVPLALTMVIWNLVASWQATVVRLNLSEAESAAYFFINRFADVGQWAGLSLLFVAFPTIAAAREEVRDWVLKRTLALTLLAGAAVAFGYWLFLGPVMHRVTLWRDYAPYAGSIALFTFRYAMGVSVGAFMSCEQAAGNFRYLYYLVPCIVGESAVLACLHRLDTMLDWLTLTVVVQLVLVWTVVLRRGRRKSWKKL